MGNYIISHLFMYDEPRHFTDLDCGVFLRWCISLSPVHVFEEIINSNTINEFGARIAVVWKPIMNVQMMLLVYYRDTRLIDTGKLNQFGSWWSTYLHFPFTIYGSRKAKTPSSAVLNVPCARGINWGNWKEDFNVDSFLWWLSAFSWMILLPSGKRFDCYQD